jgi:glucose-6-phosphate 1-dehydrogenase (EC 1.1.1.49)
MEGLMKSKSIQDQALIIFGASGDLTYRKLIPAIFDLHKQNSLPKNFAVLGVARSQFTDDTFRDKMKDGIKQFALAKDALDEEIEQFCRSYIICQSIQMTGQNIQIEGTARSSR